jgi:peptide/nickel transport system substrate-binding protein
VATHIGDQVLIHRKVLIALLGSAAIVAAACGSTSTPGPSTTTGKPLILEGTTGVTYTDDFNPYDNNSLAKGANMRSLIWEPLYEMDALDPGQNHPWLATSYSFANGGKDLTVTVRSGVKFSDGSSMGPADVAATFKLMENSKADLPGVPAQSADPTVSGSSVTLHFATSQYTNLFIILGSTFILPASMANSINSNPTATITHSQAIGTGPFVPTSFSTSVVKFTPNSHYWGGTPPESEVDVPNVSSNTNPVSLLTTGQLDWAGNDIPNVYPDYVNLDPQHNHAWFASGNTVVLWFNQNPGNGGATGIGDPAVRRAVSYGLDRNAMALLGESGYEQPASSSSALILPNQKAYLPTDGSLTNDLSTSGNVPDAKTAAADKLPTGDDVYDILTADGYTPPTGSSYSNGTYTSGGNCTSNLPATCWEKGGQDISFTVYDPVSFTDYWEDATLASQELQALGMDVTTKPAQGYSDWNTTLTSNPSGWQTALHWGNGGNIPFVQLDDWLDTSVGSTTADYIGFKNDPNAQAAITAAQAYAGTDPSNTSALYTAAQAMEKIVSTDAPVVPVLYGADWNVYSSAKYTGWPDASNPYMDPSPDDPELPYILMQLKPVPGA